MGILINQGRQIGGLSEQDQANIGKVTQTETTTDAEYEILFSGTADNITRTEGAGKSEGMTYNANHKALTIGTRFPDSTIGDYSFSHGSGNTASGEYSHAEGAGTRATGQYSHAEGGGNTASGVYSHAAGGGTTASGDYSHTEGGGTTASGMYSHVEGGGTIAKNAYQHVFGMYNTPDPSTNSADQKGTYIEIVGNGTISGSTLTTSNARTLDWSGNETLKGNLTVGGTSITVNGKTVAHSGNVGTGDSNGQVKIAGTNASVKGLAAAAYRGVYTKSSLGDIGWGTEANRTKVVDVSAIAFWNGRHSGTSSNLQYCDRGRFGTIVTKATGDYVAASGGTFSGWVNFTGFTTNEGVNIGNTSKNGYIEIYHSTPYIDFHYNKDNHDYTHRLICSSVGNWDFVSKNTASTQAWVSTILNAEQFKVRSSIHIKENIKDIEEDEALKLLELRPVSFDYKDRSDGKDQRGLIAEEVMDILPNTVLIPEGYTEFDPENPNNVPGIDYSKFVPYLIKMCQIQQEQINALSEKLDNLNKN